MEFYKNKNYWNKYIPLDVQINWNFCNVKPRHYYNDVLYTRSPFYLCMSIFSLVFFFLMALKQMEYGLLLCAVSLVLLVYNIICWFNELRVDTFIFGKYNRKMTSGMMFGFWWFIVSEIFLFFGLFWAYFDRLFDPSFLMGNNSLPYGLEPLFGNPKPFIATCLLISSGCLANISYIYLRRGWWFYSLASMYGAFVLGAYFLIIQINEYKHLSFTINDSAMASGFYLLTGFHGAHVFVGLCMLGYQLHLLSTLYIDKHRFVFFINSIIYWHFVDWVWIFLVISIYVVNWNISYSYLW
jgi:cytochrome c oxidase subunit 3